MMKTGLNDASGVIQALGESFFIFSLYFLIPTNVLLHRWIVIYDIHGREGGGDENGLNNTSGIVRALLGECFFSFFIFFDTN